MYTASLHQENKVVENDYKFLGKVEANTKKQLKQNAVKHCKSWNHWGKVSVTIEETGEEFNIIVK